MTPAPAQGALAIEVRSSDVDLISVISKLDHLPTRRCVEADRSLLSAFGGGCHLPVGAYAVCSGDQMTMCGTLGLPDGSRLIRLGIEGDVNDPKGLGLKLADLIRKAGGEEILSQLDEEWNQ
jgi:hydroxymethylbilane synthase